MPILSFDRAFEKQPAEQKTIRAEFADVGSALVVSGYALSTAEIKIFDSTGADQTSAMIEGIPTVDGTNQCVLVTIKAGEDQNEYYARFKTTWTKGGQPDQVLEHDLLIRVRQMGF